LNWWGNATGPTHASNPGGAGQSVVGSTVSLLPFVRTTVTLLQFSPLPCPLTNLSICLLL
jgi:hypothetical protein